MEESYGLGNQQEGVVGLVERCECTESTRRLVAVTNAISLGYQTQRRLARIEMPSFHLCRELVMKSSLKLQSLTKSLVGPNEKPMMVVPCE